jgi:hypothetical protein
MGAWHQPLHSLWARQTKYKSPVDSDVPGVKLGQPCPSNSNFG